MKTVFEDQTSAVCGASKRMHVNNKWFRILDGSRADIDEALKRIPETEHVIFRPSVFRQACDGLCLDPSISIESMAFVCRWALADNEDDDYRGVGLSSLFKYQQPLGELIGKTLLMRHDSDSVTRTLYIANDYSPAVAWVLANRVSSGKSGPCDSDVVAAILGEGCPTGGPEVPQTKPFKFSGIDEEAVVLAMSAAFYGEKQADRETGLRALEKYPEARLIALTELAYYDPDAFKKLEIASPYVAWIVANHAVHWGHPTIKAVAEEILARHSF